MTSIDKFLAGKPELRKHFIEHAGDPGVSGDVLWNEMKNAGIPAKRTAVFLWRRSFRLVDRHRQADTLAARVAQAVLKLGRQRLIELATELGVGTGGEGRKA